MSTFTTAKSLEQVARGGDVGTWDTPTNSNWGIVDAALGQTATIPLNNTNVTLSPGQFQCFELIFSSTLTGSVSITFPTSFTGPYAVQNLCSGSSAFVITLQTTAGGQVVGCPPGEVFEVINDGTNLKYRNFGRVGSYWDYAGSSTPAWNAACTIPPYLNCDGTAFSSATYPALATILGGTTLPDSKGRARFTLNQGSGRITSTGAGSQLDGNTNFAGGGTQTISQANLPNVTLSSTGLTITSTTGVNPLFNQINGFQSQGGLGVGLLASPLSIAGAVPLGGSGQTIVPPGYIGGLTLIRAA